MPESKTAPVLGVGVPEASKAIGVSNSTVRGLIRRGDLAAKRIGSRVIIRVADLEALLSSGSKPGRTGRVHGNR